MSNIHPVYVLIQSLESAEKAYFKRFGFKKESKNNDSFKRLFDLIDRQQVFDLDKILSDKKLNDNVKVHIHVNLNYLQKRIVQSLLDFRRDTDTLSSIFTLVEEFNLYKDKKLFPLAIKTMKSIHKMVLNNDYYLLKPFIKNLEVELNRKRPGRDYKVTNLLISDLELTVKDFSILAKTQLIGLKIEGIMDRNGGTLLKYSKDKDLAQYLIEETKDTIALDKKDFQLRSVLANNLFILTLMVGKWQDFEQISSTLIDFYKENMKGRMLDAELYDFLAILINLSYFNLALGENSYHNSLEILKEDQHLLKEGETKKKLMLQVHTLHLLKVALYGAQELEESEIIEFQNIFQNVPPQSIEGLAYMRQMALVLFKRGSYQNALDKTSDILHQDMKGMHSTGIIATRMIRVLAWLKLENLMMFETELNQIYRVVLDLDKDKLIRKIVNYVKRLSSKPSKQKKLEELEELQESFDGLLEANQMSEYLSLKTNMDLIFSEAEYFPKVKA